MGPFHSKKGLGVGGTKKRVRIVEQETKRLQQVSRGLFPSEVPPLILMCISRATRNPLLQVLAHPQYRADPIAAITTHLSSKLPMAPEPPKQKADPQRIKQQKARRKWEQRLLQKQDGSDMTVD